MGEYTTCDHKECVTNPAEYKISGGQLYVIRHAGRGNRLFDVHEIWIFATSSQGFHGIDQIFGRVRTDKGWREKFFQQEKKYYGLVVKRKCKKGLLGFGWKLE